MDTAGMVTLKYCLANAKNQLRLDDKFDQHILQLIIDCITEINCFHIDLTGPQVALMTAVDNMADLPEDFVDYVRIGQVVNGKIVTFSYNPNISIPMTGECGLDTNPYQSLGLEFPTYTHFGKGGGYNTVEYRIDKKKRRIILRGQIPNNQFVLEYISTGIGLTEKTFIPRAAVPAIVSYVAWKYVLYDPRHPNNDKVMRGQLYADELKRLNRATYSMTMDEIMDAIYQGYRQTIKR